ncbi:RyR domain-containing protein [Paractinoplanes maris]|uniref:RyR domain-containing protein n=1 Tax=Paractinoplanes maris TaxID=1734446 RepID=UPI002020884C|nr:RyR domain-containing protein [Actinoplanes maris]
MSWVPDLHDTAALTLPPAVVTDLEQLAEHVHNVWGSKRLADGWRYGPERSTAERTMPSLVPYADLPEDERDYDRELVTETVKMLLRLGYRVSRDPS